CRHPAPARASGDDVPAGTRWLHQAIHYQLAGSEREVSRHVAQLQVAPTGEISRRRVPAARTLTAWRVLTGADDGEPYPSRERCAPRRLLRAAMTATRLSPTGGQQPPVA